MESANLDDLLGSKEEPETAKRLPPNAGKGRPAGTPNKLTAKIKAAIETALDLAGQDAAAAAAFTAARAEGKSVEEAHAIAGAAAPHGTAEDYMRRLANEEPKAFAGLLGKLLPTKIAGSDDPEDKPVIVEKIERVIVKAKGAA